MDLGQGPMEDLVTSGPNAPLSDILQRTYRGRRVLVTGHNGFVGSWLSLVLADAGALVTGLSLPPEEGGLANALGLDTLVESLSGDITQPELVESVVAERSPEIVFHLAAQALVLPSYTDPLSTIDANVMGTARVLEALRTHPGAAACVVVTSDKCYATAEGAHIESDPLGGDDPYSASKGAAEIVAHAYQLSYFKGGTLGMATSRAGNIVGGGDWAAHRIVPDCARAVREAAAVVLRRPHAIRPWQHVLDAVAGYLRLGDALLADRDAFAEAWNFGPSAAAAATVGEFVTSLIAKWREHGIEVLEPIFERPGVPERGVLTLDSSKAERRLGWVPRLDLDATIGWTVEWYAQALASAQFDALGVTRRQVRRFLDADAAIGEPAVSSGLTFADRD
ncbi:MAG: rfbG [Acidimicrobiaceae bacterium]|nr:rfbG [Acidimicrobiaceae bacterium]